MWGFLVFFFLIIYFGCVLPAYVPVYLVCEVPWRTEEDGVTPGTRVTDGCELEIKPGSSRRATSALTIELSLYLCMWFLFGVYDCQSTSPHAGD